VSIGVNSRLKIFLSAFQFSASQLLPISAPSKPLHSARIYQFVTTHSSFSFSVFSISAFIPKMHADPRQTAIWKSMSLSEKYNLFAATIRQARELKRIGLRLKHPTDTPEETETKLASLWLHARP
jgi:hypothetical protein